MKNLIIFIMLIVGLPVSLCANPLIWEPLILQVHWEDPEIGQNPPAKNPVTPPIIAIDDHTLCFFGTHEEYTLQLLNGDNVVYTTCVTSETIQVMLPTTLIGEYELRLVTSSCYFSANIYLQ